MRVPQLLFMAMEGTSAARSRWGASIPLKTHFKSGFLQEQRKDKKGNKSWHAIPVDELIGHYRITKAYKSHLKYQHYAPLWEFYNSVKGLYV